MDIQPGQTWSIPPHGPDIYVHSADDVAVLYSAPDRTEPTHDQPRASFEAHLTRLAAVVRT